MQAAAAAAGEPHNTTPPQQQHHQTPLATQQQEQVPPADTVQQQGSNSSNKDPREEAKDAREALKKEWDDAVRKTKPKDTAAGLKSGIATAAAGVASGVVGLFAAPIVGARQEGASGFAKGLATGECRGRAMREFGPVVRSRGSWRACIAQPAWGLLSSSHKRAWAAARHVAHCGLCNGHQGCPGRSRARPDRGAPTAGAIAHETRCCCCCCLLLLVPAAAGAC
jgi:hypothetical protein